MSETTDTLNKLFYHTHFILFVNWKKSAIRTFMRIIASASVFLCIMTFIMYVYKTVIKLHDTDAAGILFFSHQFEIVHDAYESLLDKLGVGFPILIRKKNYFLPIVHAESDYKAPLFVGDRLTVEVRLANLGTTSFTFAYRLLNEQRQVVGTARTVHVTVSKKTKKKIPLPAEMRRAIEKFRRT